ncbi:hypothetical protein [Rhizobium indicum]|uniref:Uncharacterized protein n=1 Tax=Rhizobium indicum TaxID=2583231 RepID=A0ABX6P8F5_9HYPH|nr:hypothetical protein [Rhizobium indicum]QKK15228.1 hypothetical protein FFM53_001965 [Rhizobium indicum]
MPQRLDSLFSPAGRARRADEGAGEAGRVVSTEVRALDLGVAVGVAG